MTVPRLFGTSGIRGIFTPEPSVHPSRDFVTGNLVSRELAFLIGKAVASIHKESGMKDPVEIWQDVRESGMPLARALISGLQISHAHYLYRGIAPTIMYTMRPDKLVVVITASHNPIEFNGFKIFMNGRPLVRDDEVKIETLIHQWSQSPDNLSSIEKPPLNPVSNTRLLQLDTYRNSPVMKDLGDTYRFLLSGHYLPVDFAYGANACPVDDSGKIQELSPQLSVLLSLGFPIIGYGCVQNPSKTNNRIGAAYAYGETSDQPESHELSAFANGKPGYGVDAQRVLFWPVTDPDDTHSDLSAWITEENHTNYTLTNDFSTETVLIVHLDDPDTPEQLLNIINEHLKARIPLPGLMVDCDADRILVTTPVLAQTEIPYLTGDGMIRFFAESSPPETYDEVAFTVESGLALDVALERLANRHEKMGKKPFGIRKVTVGDRAIIDCFMEAGDGFRMGGEPSGHIIFCKTEAGRAQLTDDPIITYLTLLHRVMDQGGSLDNILDQLYMVIPEVFCARKPDARAVNGIQLKEKEQLELWKDGEWGLLSHYATDFVPRYIEMFAEMTGSVFSWNSPSQIVLSDSWKNLVDHTLKMPSPGSELPLAEIQFPGGQQLVAFLYLDSREWAGPEVIRMNFRYRTREGINRLVGEGVFRNSGTSPKNAGYHKLWPENPQTGTAIPEIVLSRELIQLASKRAEFTDHYVVTVLRTSN